MRIEHFSDEHGIYARASYEAFLVSKEEAASIRKYIDELRELVRAMWLYDYAGKFSSAPDDVEHVAMVYQRMRELGVDA